MSNFFTSLFSHIHWPTVKLSVPVILLMFCTLLNVWMAHVMLTCPAKPCMNPFQNEVKVTNCRDSTFNRSTSNDVIKERDLLRFVSAELNIELLKQAYLEKIEDLKRKNAWRSFGKIKQCAENETSILVCLDTACNSMSPPESDENLQKVFKPLTRIKDDVTRRFRQALVGSHADVKEVTFVTAASSNHYYESQALLKTLHNNVFPYLKNFTLVLYDLGLTPHQRLMMTKYCRCQVRSFPFKVLPERLTYLKGYTFKPIIIQALLPSTEILIWADSSVRFRNGSLKPLLEAARSAGLLASNNMWAHAEFTSKSMFDYFGDVACAYSVYKQFESGLVVLHNEAFIRDVVVKTWWACALDPQCMTTTENRKQHGCKTSVRKYTKCHRFDQAALTMILAKLFRNHIQSFCLPKTFHRIRQGHSEKYFLQLELEANRSRHSLS